MCNRYINDMSFRYRINSFLSQLPTTEGRGFAI